MTRSQLPETVLLLLAFPTVFSREPKLMLFQSRMNIERLQLLKTWPVSSIQQCLAHRKSFLLPQQSVSRPQYGREHALAVLHEVLQQIFTLLQTHASLGVWKENNIENVLAALHQQLEYVQSLAELEADRQGAGRTLGYSVQNLRLQVKAYFRRIHNFLESQRYSSCAWIIVQVEINRCMFFVFRLTTWLSKQELVP
ncbi:interferon epsilon [Acomys russatus]|uniref:interferon epsilon n=1 Tax=Acomys russatus TaxID=60746 RepID=UPI0021E29793|nr:interferon epsilon [Acomys russatus]